MQTQAGGHELEYGPSHHQIEAKEFADTWSPTLVEVVGSWNPKYEGGFPALMEGEVMRVNADTGASLEERIILGHFAKVAPHLAKEWLDEQQEPTLSRVVYFWRKEKGNSRLGLESSGKNNGVKPLQESTLASKLSLIFLWYIL